jgi:hypothetical protein
MPNIAYFLQALQYTRLLQSTGIEVATVLCSIPASSEIGESEGRQMKQCWIKYIKNLHKIPASFKKYLKRELRTNIIFTNLYFNLQNLPEKTKLSCYVLCLENCWFLKVHKRENFWAPILNTVLFHSYLCINSKVLLKKFFDWALIGEDTIVLRTLSIRRAKNFQQAR